MSPAELLDLSDERDLWMRRMRSAYDRGFADGRAAACIAIAEIEERYQSAEQWDKWARWLRTRSQEYVRAARAKPPARRSQQEMCAVLGVRLAGLQAGEFTGGQHG